MCKREERVVGLSRPRLTSQRHLPAILVLLAGGEFKDGGEGAGVGAREKGDGVDGDGCEGGGRETQARKVVAMFLC